MNLGSSKSHSHSQLPNFNVKRKRFSQPIGTVDSELNALPLQEPKPEGCTTPKIILSLKIIPPKKPHLGISATSSIVVPNHSKSALLSMEKSPKPTPREIDGLNCQDFVGKHSFASHTKIRSGNKWIYFIHVR